MYPPVRGGTVASPFETLGLHVVVLNVPQKEDRHPRAGVVPPVLLSDSYEEPYPAG